MTEKQNNLLGWLTNASIEETRRYASDADGETILAALKIETRIGAIAILKRELFKRIKPGDEVWANTGSYFVKCKVEGVFLSHRYVGLSGSLKKWGWKDIAFTENGK